MTKSESHSDDTTISNLPPSSYSSGIAFSTIVNQSNIIMILWFLAIYFILYYFLTAYFNKGNNQGDAEIALSRTIDFTLLGLAIVLLLSSYYSSSSEQKSNFISNTLRYMKDFFNDSSTIVSLLLALVLFYMIVYVSGIPMKISLKPLSIHFIENVLWILIIVAIIISFFKFIFGISIIDILFGGGDELINYWSTIPKEVNIPGMDNIDTPQNEVFNVSNNLYTYDDAQAICQAYGSRIATYDDVEKSYNDGGEWCNYGWTDGQMILFPTQKNTWSKLQESPEHKNDCGRPGINGGYMANPYMKFGVNCYGIKPEPKKSDLSKMDANSTQLYPKSIKDKVLEAKIKYWKENADKLLLLSSFNKEKWSQY